MTILIVDDSPDIRSSLRAALEMQGHTVLEAGYLMGVESMVASNSSIRTVIMDGNVPFSDQDFTQSSLPLCHVLAKLGVKVILHSGDPYLCEQGRREGLTVVEKGNVKELLAAVNSDG